jgi:hypothetical protein
VVAFVGAGGKSSAILHVARELREAGVKVLAAPTTKMLVEEAEGVGPLVTSESGDDLPEKIAEKLVEADGSRRLPLKGTAEHEPALPDGVTLVVAVGGVRALGKPVDEEHVHRPEVFSTLTGVGPGRSMAEASVIGHELWRGGVRKVVLTSLPDETPGRVWVL